MGAIVLPVLLALFVLIYYFYTRNSTKIEKQFVGEFDGDFDPADLAAPSPLPVQNAEGSLSISDVSADAAPPPPQSFSIDDSEPSADTMPEPEDDNKIV